MKPKFSLRKVWGDWRSIRTPDGIEFHLKSGTSEMFSGFASLVELVDIYENLKFNREYDTMIGTGTDLKIVHCENSALLVLDEDIKLNSSSNELEQAVKELLRDVFLELNGGPEEMAAYDKEAHPEIKRVYEEIVG